MNPKHPGVMMAHLEKLLGIPREHLEFPLWFLRKHGLTSRTDNGRYSVTAKGVAKYESVEHNEPTGESLPSRALSQ